MTPYRALTLSKVICISLLLISAITVHADGMPENTPARETGNSDTPALNIPIQILADGRVERWDTPTGQWLEIDRNLHFSTNQQVNFNYLADGRVLFFVTREGGNMPEYQVRIWNPKSGTVEKLQVSIKPKPDNDIAVLADGRVLIINGSEGSADIWDSSTNAVTHTEEPLLENSRWRILPLKNKQALLIETFPDDPAAIRRSITSSVTLLWNPEADEWKQIADLPVPFKDSGNLAELAAGLIKAGNTGEIYQLASFDEEWEKLITAQPSENTNGGIEAPQDGNRQVTVPPAQSSTEAFSWETYKRRTVNDLWLMVVFIPAFIFLIGTWVKANRIQAPFIISSAIHKLFYFVMAIFVAVLIWILQRHAPPDFLQTLAIRWWENNRDEIAVIIATLAIFGPIILYFILRRMETEKLAAFLNKASIAARSIIIGVIVFLLIDSIAGDYKQLQQHTLKVSDEFSWLNLLIAIGDHQWVLLAILVPTIAYFLLRGLNAEKIDRIVRFGNSVFFVAVVAIISLPIFSTVYANKQDKLEMSVNSCGRSVISDTVSIDRIKKWIQCVDSEKDFLAGLFFFQQLAQTKEVVLSLPSAPCRFIGVWTSTRTNSKYKVTLTDDNRYEAVPIYPDNENALITRGFWGANDDFMVWFEDNQFIWPIDLNTFKPESRNRFSLIEVNGERTDFELIDAIKSNNCTL